MRREDFKIEIIKVVDDFERVLELLKNGNLTIPGVVVDFESLVGLEENAETIASQEALHHGIEQIKQFKQQSEIYLSIAIFASYSRYPKLEEDIFHPTGFIVNRPHNSFKDWTIESSAKRQEDSLWENCYNPKKIEAINKMRQERSRLKVTPEVSRKILDDLDKNSDRASDEEIERLLEEAQRPHPFKFGVETKD